RDKNLPGLGIVQGIVQTRNRARAVAKRTMRGDVLDALAVDIDLAAVAQAFKVLGAGEWPGRPNHVFWFLPIHQSLRSSDGGPLHREHTARVGQSLLNRSPNFDEDQAHLP